MTLNQQRLTIPEEIGLLHRQIARSHVFTGIDLPGFQISHPVFKAALEGIGPALSSHLSIMNGVSLRYELAHDYMLFFERIGHYPTLVIAFKYPREGALFSFSRTAT
jgi:hypothetical protein